MNPNVFASLKVHGFPFGHKTQQQTSLHPTTPSEFIPSIEDCAKTDEESQMMQEDYYINLASCVGALIYLAYTQPDIIYAVAKFSKFT